MAARFFGRFEHSLDAKGRVTLPARFRSNFETKIVVTQHEDDKCLALWTPDEFEKKLAEVQANQNRTAELRKQARRWASAVAEVEMDRQGRVPLQQYLRDYAGLRNAVLVIGAIDRIELWDPSEWEADNAEFVNGEAGPAPAGLGAGPTPAEPPFDSPVQTPPPAG